MTHRDKKIIKILVTHENTYIEKYEEILTLKLKSSVKNRKVVVNVVKPFHDQNYGLLYMKGTIQQILPLFQNKEKEYTNLNKIQKVFIQQGIESRIFIKRILEKDELNLLVTTINEGTHSNEIENSKLQKMIQHLVSMNLQILGILGIQKQIHLRNRIVIDDFIENGVKPWIISKETEQEHMISLNSLRMFH